MSTIDYRVETFETELLGVPVGRLTWPDDGAPGDDLAGLVAGWLDDGVWLVSCRLPEGSPGIRLLEDAGFRPVEALVTFRHSLDAVPDDAEVAPAGLDDVDSCLAVATRAFVNDRLHRDPEVPAPIADRVRQAWVRNNLSHRGDATFIVREGGAVVGFNQCLVRGDQAVIDLIAVDPGQQGKGLGRRLVAGALRHYKNRAHSMIVGTQVDNLPSTALYSSAGFFEIMRQSTLHWVNPAVAPAPASEAGKP